MLFSRAVCRTAQLRETCTAVGNQVPGRVTHSFISINRKYTFSAARRNVEIPQALHETRQSEGALPDEPQEPSKSADSGEDCDPLAIYRRICERHPHLFCRGSRKLTWKSRASCRDGRVEEMGPSYPRTVDPLWVYHICAKGIKKIRLCGLSGSKVEKKSPTCRR